jgi:hypothetical protein
MIRRMGWAAGATAAIAGLAAAVSMAGRDDLPGDPADPGLMQSMRAAQVSGLTGPCGSVATACQFAHQCVNTSPPGQSGPCAAGEAGSPCTAGDGGTGAGPVTGPASQYCLDSNTTSCAETYLPSGCTIVWAACTNVQGVTGACMCNAVPNPIPAGGRITCTSPAPGGGGSGGGDDDDGG